MANLSAGSKLLNNQVIRFVLSAGIGFLVDMASFSLFFHFVFATKTTYHVFSLTVHNYILSFSISFFLGVVVNFIITRYFVFSESKSSASKQFFRFVSVAIIGYFANFALIKIFIIDLGINPLIARPSAALSLFFASFFIHKFFSFSLSLRHHSPGVVHPEDEL